MRSLLARFYDGSNLPEFLLALLAFSGVIVGGLYRIDAGTISDARAAVVSDYVRRFPGMLAVMKADREAAYRQSYTTDMPRNLDYEAHFRKQQLDRGEDTELVSADGTETYRVTALFPRLVRKQFLGSIFGDEPNTLAAVGRMKPQRLDFNPRWFFYGGAYQYPVAAAVGVGVVALHGPRALGLDAVLRDPRIARTMYIAARLVGVLAAAGGVLALGLLVSRLLGPRAACIAVVLGGSSPWLVLFGHLAKPYTTALFWSFCSVYFTVAHIQSRRIRDFLLSAVFAGLAVGSNYVFVVFTGLMMTVKLVDAFFPVTPLARAAGWRQRLDHALVLCLAYGLLVALVFLLVNPYWLFTLDVVRSELRMADKDTMLNYRSFRAQNAGWTGVLRTLLYAANWPLVAAGAVGIAVAIARAARGTLPAARFLGTVTLWCLPFLVFSIGYNSFILRQSTHYMAAFIILFLALFAAAALSPSGAGGPAGGPKSSPGPLARAAILLILAAGLAYNMGHTARYLLSFDDLRTRNAEFGAELERTIPRGATITTRLAVCDTTDSFEQSMNHPPQVWISAILPDFDFFAREWRFRLHVLPEPSPIDAEFIIDTIGDAWSDPVPGLVRNYELVAERRRRVFVPGTWQDRFWPQIIDTYEMKDIQVWRRHPLATEQREMGDSGTVPGAGAA